MEATQYKLGEWIGTHDAEKIRCASAVLNAEMKLRQALVHTDGEAIPNRYRLATVLACFDQLTALCGEYYRGLFDTLRAELLRVIYVDWWQLLRPNGHYEGSAQAYAQCVPFFDALSAERLRCAENEKSFEAWKQAQSQAIESAEGKRRALEGAVGSIQDAMKKLLAQTDLISEQKARLKLSR